MNNQHTFFEKQLAVVSFRVDRSLSASSSPRTPNFVHTHGEVRSIGPLQKAYEAGVGITTDREACTLLLEHPDFVWDWPAPIVTTPK
jgi:hypothetical protein